MKRCRRKQFRDFLSRITKAPRTFSICLFLLLFCLGPAAAKVKKEAAARIKTPPAASQAMTENIKSALTANPWPIYVISQDMLRGEIKSSVKTDLLTFTQDTVLSQNLSSEGYSKGGSSYRVKLDPSGAYVWESIQLHENQADTVLLKGELKPGVMKGVIVYQPQGKPARTLNFTTVQPE